MKVQISVPLTLDIKFPCLMQSINGNNLIVLFIDWEEGLILDSESELYQQNTMALNFKMENFVTFNGSVTLSNS